MDVVNAEKAPMENKSREKVNRRNRKREKYVPSSEPLELPFCRICGKRASGIHFGVYSCEACKVNSFVWVLVIFFVYQILSYM